MECQYIQIISSYDKSINLLPFCHYPLLVCVFRGATKFRIFLSFSPPYGGSNHSKNTFPSLYKLPTSCTHYIHFQFAFLGGMPPSLEFFFLSALLMEGQTIRKIPSHPYTYFLLPVHAPFTSGLHFWGV